MVKFLGGMKFCFPFLSNELFVHDLNLKSKASNYHVQLKMKINSLNDFFKLHAIGGVYTGTHVCHCCVLGSLDTQNTIAAHTSTHSKGNRSCSHNACVQHAVWYLYLLFFPVIFFDYSFRFFINSAVRRARMKAFTVWRRSYKMITSLH